AVGAQVAQSDVGRRLSALQEPLRRLLQSLAAALPPAERRARIEEVERLLLARLPLGESLALTLCARICVPLARLAAVDLAEGVEVLQLDFMADGTLIARHEIPVLGALSARDVANVALSSVGEAAFLQSLKSARAPPDWFRLGRSLLAEAAANVRAVRRGQRGARRLLEGVRDRAKLRATLVAYGGPTSPHASRLAAHLSALGETPAETRQGPSAGMSEGIGRAAYWEGVFREADPWNYGSVYEQTKYQQTLDLIGSAQVAEALELGCAEGHFTVKLAERAEHLIAADISSRALTRAAERCAGLSNVEFRRIDLISDDLPSGIDLIVCSEVLYYLDGSASLPGVIAKLRDALAPGGRLVMAHAFLLADDLSSTGFDWDHFGARAIHDATAATAGLRLTRSTITELYRIDCFQRAGDQENCLSPKIQRAAHGEPLDPSVERGVVWGGAKALRNNLKRTRAAWAAPVLMYHRVSEDGPTGLDRWRVSPETFKAQMRRLRSLGYHTVTSDDLLGHRTRGEPLPGKPVLISFDDAYADFERHAWPVLQRCGFGAEVFVPTDHVGGAAEWDAAMGPPAALMDWSALRRLSSQGVRFGSHMASHARARELSTDALMAEAVRSRVLLQRQLQRPVRSIAAPYGELDPRFLWAIEKAGYWINFTTDHGLADVRGHLYRMPRIEVLGHWTADDLERALDEAEREAAPSWRLDPAEPLVSVVIPAHDAEGTLDETLRSVRGQTHQALEIIVVDDGSCDRTPVIAEHHAAEDPRVRLIRQANAGVAAARNRGVAEAKAELIAPIDADDLWAPTKIEKQLRVLWAGGERMGLAYAWCASLDARSRVIRWGATPPYQGQVLSHICRGNFIGNGSSPLIRKRAILECGGYDATLRDRDAQGCEDLLLYFHIAERYDFGLTPEYLIGYRQLPETMSGDLHQMLRSFRLVAQEMRSKYPQYAGETRLGEAYVANWLFGKAREAGKLADAGALAWFAARRSPMVGLSIARSLASGLMRRLSGRPGAEQDASPFLTADAPAPESDS
ncbi:MAG: glycosyltransferase, partial [Caulobacteraceae bacterium]|nr:glycosyltransferase [Caulobacteraceae bacterium]